MYYKLSPFLLPPLFTIQTVFDLEPSQGLRHNPGIVVHRKMRKGGKKKRRRTG